jgi:hypothetical protein
MYVSLYNEKQPLRGAAASMGEGKRGARGGMLFAGLQAR